MKSSNSNEGFVDQQTMFISLLRNLELLHKLGFKTPFADFQTNRFFSGPWSKYVQKRHIKCFKDDY